MRNFVRYAGMPLRALISAAVLFVAALAGLFEPDIIDGAYDTVKRFVIAKD